MSVNDPMMESKHHDPLLDCITCWSHEHPTECVQVRYEHGSWVRYEDHAAAIAAAYTLMGAAIQNAIEAEQQRIVFIVEDYYKVAPKAAEPLLRLIKEEDDD